MSLWMSSWANADPSHLLYGAWRRSRRKLRRMRSRTSRAAITREPRSSPTSAVRPTNGSSWSIRPPLAGEQPKPDVVRIPRQRLSRRCELARVVTEYRSSCDFEQGLLRRAQPGLDRYALARIEPESVAKPFVERHDLDVMLDRLRVPAEADWPSTGPSSGTCRNRAHQSPSRATRPHEGRRR
jgi:hypothetical protein